MSRGLHRPVMSEFEHPTTTLADVVGMDEAKQVLQKVADSLRWPASSEHSRKNLFHGVLLVGPRSDERALLARAVAGEAGVPLLRISVPELVESLTQFDPVGGGPLAVPSRSFFFRIQEMIGQVYGVLRGSFDQLKNAAPAVLLIDDIDAFERVNRGREGIINRLVTELDGLEPERPVVMIATTNQPQSLHRALSYVGRFDWRIVMVNTQQGGQASEVASSQDTVNTPPLANLLRHEKASKRRALLHKRQHLPVSVLPVRRRRGRAGNIVSIVALHWRSNVPTAALPIQRWRAHTSALNVASPWSRCRGRRVN